MIEQYAHSLATYLQAHPNMGGLITFFISFLESLPVVGTVIPGSITMAAVGLLVGTSILPMGITLLWAVLGAFIGDLLGYILGRYYNERLRSMWPFKTRPNWLELGKRFFQKHGGKSIYIGRFIGPLRSIIPLIAGGLNMPWQRFIIAAIPAATLWAIAYMLPGYILGALSLQLPPKTASKFILILFLVIVILTVFAWLFQHFYSKLVSSYQFYLKRLWHYLQTHPRLKFIPKLITSKQAPDDYQQLTWLLLTVFFGVAFIATFLSVVDQNVLTLLNRPIFEFLRTVRHATSDKVLIAITMLGDSRVLSLSGTLIFFWLAYKRYSREAFYWLIVLAISIAVPLFYKLFFYFPRPSGLLHASSASSFPSGHTFQAIMFFGFLATLLATHMQKKYRRFLYYAATIIVVLVGFSRLYLGAHWLTDVLASITLGYCCVALVTLFYRRQHTKINVLQFGFIALTCITTIWIGFYTFNFQKNMARYTLLWPSKTVEVGMWWNRLNPVLPIYRQNRIGKPSEPMNIQYSGDVQQLKALLASNGWRSSPDETLLKNTLAKLVRTPNNFNTLLPSLYLNHPPILFMIKDEPEGKLILRLWDSNVYFAQTWDPLYIGNVVEYQMDPDKESIIYSFNVTHKFQQYVTKLNWRLTTITAQKIPEPLVKKNWEGEILQISAPSFY